MPIQYDEHGRPKTPTFRTPQDFVAYVDSLGPSASEGARRQADEIRRNPDGWEMSPGQFGQPRKKDDWLARNLPWLGPAVVGAGVGAAALAGGGAAAAGGSGAATGVLPSSSIPAAWGMGAPTAIASQGVSAGPFAAGAAGATGGFGSSVRDWITKPKNLLGVASIVPPVIKALRGGNEGPFGTDDAIGDELSDAFALQRKRMEQTQPVFDVLVNMAYGGTPTRYRGAAPAGYPSEEQELYPYSPPRFK